MLKASLCRKSFLFRLMNATVTFCFSLSFILPSSLSHAQLLSVLNLPVPGTIINPSQAFVPAIIKGMTIHPENPLLFDFIIDTGNATLNEEEIKLETSKLVKYFLASLTIPEDELWVNLSPSDWVE